MARTDYGAILSTVIKDTSDAIREVNDTSALIAPNAWGANIRTMHSDADYENALSYIPTKTVSGAIASFSDGAGGLNLKSLKVAITAVQSGSGDPAPDNIRPITGWDSVKVSAVKQLFNGTLEQGSFNTGTGEEFPSTTRVRSVDNIPLPSGSYVLNNLNGWQFVLYVYDLAGNFKREESYTFWKNNPLSFSLVANRKINFAIRNDTNTTIVPSDVVGLTLYDSTVGQTATIALPNTVYGGELDVDSGVLTITHGYIEYDGSDDENWTYTNNGYGIAKPSDADVTSETIFCYANQAVHTTTSNVPNDSIRLGATNVLTRLRTGDNDVPTFKTWLSNNPLQLVYPLETPITVQLTPTQVEQLLGANNVWADTGDVTECIYYTTASGVQSIEGSYQRTDATGVSSVPYLIYTYTATEDCTMCFCGTIATDTSQSQGFLKMVVNDDVEYRTAGLVQYNETPFSLDNISLQSGDTVKFYGDWEGSHSGRFFHLRLSMVKAV